MNITSTTNNQFESDLILPTFKLESNDLLVEQQQQQKQQQVVVEEEDLVNNILKLNEYSSSCNKPSDDDESNRHQIIKRNQQSIAIDCNDIKTRDIHQLSQSSDSHQFDSSYENDLHDLVLIQSDIDSENNYNNNNEINNMQTNKQNVENINLIKSFDDLESSNQSNNNNNNNNSYNITLKLINFNSSNSDGLQQNNNSDETTIYNAFKISSMSSMPINDLNVLEASLKRTQASSNLNNMNDNNYNDDEISIDSKLDTPTTITIDLDSLKSADYIEENKVIMEGIHFRAAELSKLIQLLIESFDETGQVINSSNYPRVFFLMHKWFMDSDSLATTLYDLYKEYDENSREYQLKTFHSFRFWLRNFPAHFGLDESLKDMITKFWSLVRSKGPRDHLKFIDVSNIESYDWIRKQTKRNPIKSKSKTEKKSELAFDKLGADVIAHQFTYLEWKTLRRITFNEYKSYAIKGSIQDNPPLERSIQLFNGMSQWIQTMVLKKTTPKQRAERIHKFIQVAQHLRQLQNFNSLMAVVGGICHSSIARLSKTNSHLSAEDQKCLNELMDLLSSNFNYVQYRKTISELKGFFIPIIGIHLKDMISLHTAFMDKLDNNLINFRKMVQLSVIFQSLNDLQNSESPVVANTNGYLEVLQVALEMFYCEDEIYERSLTMEPRTSVSSPCSPEKRQEFADWAKSMSTPLDPRTIKKHVNDMVNTVFKNYDHDNDGFISNKEFNEIAQNFPFIDSFAVLDADKDGLISPEEMQTYFLKANHQALKNEFKHNFHEWTYYKPTYCILCDGLLWGIIKQGWKCVDCRINAHKHCKETLVMECRSKRTINLARHMSNSGAEHLTRNRSTSNNSPTRKYPNYHHHHLHRHHHHHHQKDNHLQTDAYDDIFTSGESTEEENTNDDVTFMRSNTKKETNENYDQSVNNLIQTTNTRHKRYNKKSPKRRKSLPPNHSGSNSLEVNVNVRPSCLPNALIPRGPLICSNIENLENYRIPIERTNNINTNKNNNNNSNNSKDKNAESSSSSFENTSSTASYVPKNDSVSNVINTVDLRNDKKSLAMPEETGDIDFNITFQSSPSDLNTTSVYKNKQQFHDNPATSNRHYISNNRGYSLNQKDKFLRNISLKEDLSITNNNNSNTKIKFKSAIPSDKSSPKSIPKKKDFSLKNYTDDISVAYRNLNDSDSDLNDFIEESLLSDAFSSNDEDTDVFVKLKEEETRRINLEKENEKIRKELESANAQITSLKNVMSSIVNSDKINLIQDKLDSFNLKTKDSEA